MKGEEKEVVLQGNPISEGIVIGTPFIFIEKDHPISQTVLQEKDILSEIKRYRQALKKSQLDLEIEIQSLMEEGADVAADILDSHLEMLKDPFLTEIVEQKIYHHQKNSESAIHDLIKEYSSHFQESQDKNFQGRIKDMVDVSKRVLSHLIRKKSFSTLPHNAIVITDELIPSASTCRHISGLVTEKGGPTSHTAIIARSKNLPFVSNIPLEHFSKSPKTIIIDGYCGKVILNPSLKTRKYYQELVAAKALPQIDPKMAFQTLDGYPVTVSGSIGSSEELALWKATSSSAISLVRTELFFLSQDSRVPDKEKQFETYRSILEGANPRQVTFRLFDLSSDKIFIDLDASFEHIMWMEDERFFRQHLEALLRASAFGKMRLLLPFIADVDEFRKIKGRIVDIQEEMKIDRPISIGTMVELPSAAICIDQLAKEADFLSIGTNDLTQFLLAKDRMKEKSAMTLHPSLIRLISRVVRAAKKENKPLSICGELAGNPRFVPILMGLGIKDFSLSPANMDKVTRVIQKSHYEKTKQLAQQASLIASHAQLQKMLETF